MNWDAIGAIGEVLGALAVVATLLYLAIQVRHAKTATTDATRLNRANGVQAMLLAMATDDALRSSVNKAQGTGPYINELSTRLSISADEAQRVDMYASYWFWLHWSQYASSTSPKDISELKNLVNTFYRFPYMEACWELSPAGRQILDPDFVAFVDNVLTDKQHKK